MVNIHTIVSISSLWQQGCGLFLSDLSSQLNVFYNVWSVEPMRKRRDAHEDEAFHLSVDLFDFDSHAAHLSICCRFE